MQTWKRVFAAVWTGQAFSLLSSQIVQFAIIWWLTYTTDSAAVLSVASLLGFIPQIIIGPIAGIFVDRWNRKWTMIIADGGIAVSTLLLAIYFGMGGSALWPVYVALTVRSVGSAFHWPAMESSIALLVPEGFLTRAAGINTMLYSLSAIFGQGAGALAMSVWPIHGVLLLDVFGAIIANGILAAMPIPEPERDAREQNAPNVFREFVAGWKALTGDRKLLIFTLACAAMGVFEAPPTSFTPLLITRHYQGGAVELGVVNAALGVGTLLGSIILSAWGGFKNKMMTVATAVLITGSSFFIMGLLPGSAFYGLVGMTVFLGISGAFFYGPFMALFQSRIPAAMQGRVLSMVQSLLWIASPLGLAVAGPLADRISIPFWYVVCGGMIILLGLFSLIQQLREHSK